MRAPEEFRRILLIRRKALGDALVTLPAVLAVAGAWPRADIDLVVDRPFAPLLQELAGGVRVLTYPGPPGTSWLATLRGGRYDLVIDWLGSPRTALWSLISGAPRRVGYDLPRRRWAYNLRVPRNRIDDRSVRAFAGEGFLDPLRVLGLQPGPWAEGAVALGAAQPAERLGAAYREFRARHLEGSAPRVALVMSATWPAKAWPRRHIAALGEALAARGLQPVLVPGPGDGELLGDLPGRWPAERVAPPTTLFELADLLGRCRLLAGTDNGARHLAAALGLPTVTLFGPTDPRGWNPASPRHVSMWLGVPCAPCNLSHCPLEGHPCLEGLEPTTVLAAIERVLGSGEGET